MKTFKKLFYPQKNIALIAIFLMSVNANSWDGETTESAWLSLRAEVASKLASLETLVDKANAQGVDTERAFVSIATINTFLDVTQWDYNNTEKIAELYSKWPLNKYFKKGDERYLPFDQLEDCIEVADYAMEQLNKQIRGDILLAPPIDYFAGQKILKGPDFTLNGKVVFPASLGVSTSEEYRPAFAGHMGSYHYLNQLGEDKKAKNWIRQRAVDKVTEANERFATPFYQFHGHNGGLPDWMTDGPYDVKKMDTSYTIYEGGRNFVNYDISNPNILDWLQLLNEDIVGSIANANEATGGVPVIHSLANEPHFEIRKGGWRVAEGGFSPYFAPGFRERLKNKYGTIEKLQEVYRDTSISSFDEYAVDVPLDLTAKKGSPELFDMVSYNLDRGNDYFSHLKAAVKDNDPSALITIKLLGGTVVSRMSGGIDFEYLTSIMDVTGSDFESVPDTAFFFNHEPDRDANDSWLANYSFYWSVGTQFLDYAKSIKPDAPHFNSEWHGISTGSWRDFNMKREYVRAALWTHFIHGMSMIDTWWWGRNDDGSIRESATIGAMGTLPVVLDEHARVLKEVNAHGDTVAALQKQDRFAYVYFSRDAAIQAEDVNNDSQLIYEALKLLNYAVGMTSKNLISTLDPQKDFIVVPPFSYFPENELQVLRDFKESGGRVIVYSYQDESFAFYDEYGFSRSELNFNPHSSLVFSADPIAMAKELSPLTEDLAPETLIPLTISNVQNEPAMGVLIQQATDEGSNTVNYFLVNTSKEERNVEFGESNKATSYVVRDLLNGTVAGKTISLKPMEIRLLAADLEYALPNKLSHIIAPETIKPGEKYSVAVNYTANETFNLMVELASKETGIAVGSVEKIIYRKVDQDTWYPFVVPEGIASGNYEWRALLIPQGQSRADAIDQVVKAVSVEVPVLPTIPPEPTLVPTAAVTPTPEPTATPTPDVTPTPLVTPTITVTPTATVTPTPAVSPTTAPTVTPVPTVIPTVTLEPTEQPVPTVVPTAMPTRLPTATPTSAPLPTGMPPVVSTPEPTDTPVQSTPKPTVEPTSLPTATPSTIVTPTGSVTPTVDDNQLPLTDDSGGGAISWQMIFLMGGLLLPPFLRKKRFA